MALSTAEITSAYLKRIARSDQDLNSLIIVTAKRPMAGPIKKENC